MRAAILVTLVLVACDPDLAEPPPPPDPRFVHIGLLNPFSGREAARALDFQNAARLAVREINQAGGVNGKLVDVIVRDSKTGEPEAEETSIAAVEDFAAAGAVAMIGPDTSSLVLAIHDAVDRSGIPLISATASAEVLADVDETGLLWRTCASDNLQGAALAGRIVRDGHTRVALVHVDDPYGNGLAATLDSELTAAGVTLTANVAYPAGQIDDFGPTVDALLDDETPQAIVVVGFALPSAAVMAALAERHLDPLPARYGVDANHNTAFMNNAPPQMIRGMRFIAPGSPVDNPELGEFVAAYQAVLGTEPFRTEFTYDAVYLVALALIQAGENTAVGVRDHLGEVSRPDSPDALVVGVGPAELARAATARGADLDFHGASGDIDWDERGDITAASFVIREIVDTGGTLRFEEIERISID